MEAYSLEELGTRLHLYRTHGSEQGVSRRYTIFTDPAHVWYICILFDEALLCPFSEVLKEELTLRVKEMLDVGRLDWDGVPDPYSTQNPPP